MVGLPELESRLSFRVLLTFGGRGERRLLFFAGAVVDSGTRHCGWCFKAALVHVLMLPFQYWISEICACNARCYLLLLQGPRIYSSSSPRRPLSPSRSVHCTIWRRAEPSSWAVAVDHCKFDGVPSQRREETKQEASVTYHLHLGNGVQAEGVVARIREVIDEDVQGTRADDVGVDEGTCPTADVHHLESGHEQRRCNVEVCELTPFDLSTEYQWPIFNYKK